MAATTTRDWTPAQAGYRPETQVVTSTHPETPEAPGFVQHYVLTRHGIVARTWAGTDLVEIVLRRPSHAGGTYQGFVQQVAGGWAGFDGDTREQVTQVHQDYLAAEAPLLRRRTGRRTHGTYRWPAGLRMRMAAQRDRDSAAAAAR
jgi:hypothetical protein